MSDLTYKDGYKDGLRDAYKVYTQVLRKLRIKLEEK